MDPVLNSLESDIEAENLVRMNVEHLIRQKESEYATKSDITILCGTFNAGDKVPDCSLASWLSGHNDAPVPDIIAVGSQELEIETTNQAFALTETQPPELPEWIAVLEKTLREVYGNQKFVKVCSGRIASIMLVIFIREPLDSSIRDLDMAIVSFGLLGRLGNKACVAIRFKLHDTSICFVGSHLSAQQGETERRNQDFRTINSRTAFTKFTEPLQIDSHDIVFWMGDLNYRIANLPIERCKALIDEGAIDELYRNNDELYQEMKKGNVFAGYSEGAITFRPTFKYDPGTNNWDTSPKGRIPAWCDRILWKCNDESNPVTQVAYRSHPDIMTSDHRPVSAIFKASVRIVDNVKYDTLFKQILADLGKDNCKESPTAEFDRREIDFGEIKFLESNVASFNIKNTGTIPLEFVFKPNQNNPKNPAPRWLSVFPARGKIGIGRSASVELAARIDPTIVSQIASTVTREFSDTLVLHLVCGGDTSIPVKGRLALTSFGLPLSLLNSIPTPIGLLTQSELAEIIATPPNKILKSTVPKEVCRLVDRLSEADALEHKEVLQVQGLLRDRIRIRNALDLTNSEEALPGSVTSISEALFDFLQSLPTPLIPVDLQGQCMQISSSTRLSCSFLRDVFQKNSPTEYALFAYIFKFLGEFVRHRYENKINVSFLAGLLAELVFRPHFMPGVGDNGQEPAADARVPQEAVNFIIRILAKEAGLSKNEVVKMTRRFGRGAGGSSCSGCKLL